MLFKIPSLRGLNTNYRVIKGLVYDIQKFVIHDGPGIRTLSDKDGVKIDRNLCTRCGQCVEAEIKIILELDSKNEIQAENFCFFKRIN